LAFDLSSPDSYAHFVEPLLLQRIAGDTLAQISGRSLSIREIFVDFFLVVQKVGNAGVNISQAPVTTTCGSGRACESPPSRPGDS
jgi:hypothetical protein